MRCCCMGNGSKVYKKQLKFNEKKTNLMKKQLKFKNGSADHVVANFSKSKKIRKIPKIKFIFLTKGIVFLDFGL